MARFLYTKGGKICKSKSICSIIRTRDLVELQKHLDRFLHLRFFRESIACNTLFHLKGGILEEGYTSFCKCKKDDSSSMCYIDTIGNIPQKKKSLNPTNLRIIGLDNFS
jgi:hypothetical protein